MKTKKVIAIILAGVGMLGAGAAETRADSFVVEQGFFETARSTQFGTFSGVSTFSGDTFRVSVSTGGGNFGGQVFTPDTGILVAGFGNILGLPAFEASRVILGSGTIQVGTDVHCEMFPSIPVPGAPDCGGIMTFTNPPITLAPGSTAGQETFTMTGQLHLGDLIEDIAGSGIVLATSGASFNDSALYNFSVPEPSTVVLVLSGLVAVVGWSRWRGRNAGRVSWSTAAGGLIQQRGDDGQSRTRSDAT